NDDPAAVALRLVEVIADVVAAVALRTDAVSAALDTEVGATDVRGLLRGVLLADVANPTQLIPGLFDVDTVLEPALRLVRHPAGTGGGRRAGWANGPLVDSVITIESIALHVFAAFDLTGVTGGGAQLEIAGLALAPSGGGQNGIAQNVMKDTGPTPPRPAFSP